MLAPMRSRAWVWSIAAAVATACGGSSTPTWRPSDDAAKDARDERFPSKAQLVALTGETVAGGLERPTERVQTWDLAGPFPEELGATPVADADEWEGAMTARGAVASEQMRCAARELGRFAVTERRLASRSLQRFALARCGALATDVSVRTLTGTVDASAADDAAAFASWRDQLAQMAGETPAGAEAGMWVGRAGDYGVALQVTGRPEVRIARAPRRADEAGWLRIEGEVLVATRSIDVLMNQGEWGVERCALDPLVPLPKFAALCAPNAEDAVAWIEIAAFPPDRVLGSGVFQHLTWPAGVAPTRYERRQFGSVAPGNAVRNELAALIGGARSTAGLTPLVLNAAQSDMARQLAPYYFRATDRGDHRTTDTIALGLMAGWDVTGKVDRGWFQSQLVPSADLGELLGDMFERPFGRRVLLNPHARVLAIGALHDAEQAMVGALFATYSTIDTFDAESARTAVRVALDRQRKLAGLEPSAPLPQVREAVDGACGQVSAGERGARAAMDDALSDAASALNTSVRGYLATASVLEEIDLPMKLVSSPHPVALCVALHQPPGSPWWTYSVIAITGEPGERYDEIKLPGAE